MNSQMYAVFLLILFLILKLNSVNFNGNSLWSQCRNHSNAGIGRKLLFQNFRSHYTELIDIAYLNFATKCWYFRQFHGKISGKKWIESDLTTVSAIFDLLIFIQTLFQREQKLHHTHTHYNSVKLYWTTHSIFRLESISDMKSIECFFVFYKLTVSTLPFEFEFFPKKKDAKIHEKKYFK